MPAKGWRKDEQESNLETALDNEKVSIDSILFPKATVLKLSKQMLTNNDSSTMLLSKDSQTVIQRSAVLFINYVYYHAKIHSKAQGRKVVNANDILVGLENSGFGGYVSILEGELEGFNKKKEAKKREKMLSKASSEATVKEQPASVGSSTEEPEDDDDDEDDSDGEDESGGHEGTSKKNKRVKVDSLVNSAKDEDEDMDDGDDTQENDDDVNQEAEDEEDEDEDEVEDEDEDEDEDEEDGPVLTASQKLQQEHEELAGSDAGDADAGVNEDDEEEF